MTGYQYTLIKYVHNEASGECVNVGLAFLAPERRWLKVRFNPRYGRISRFFRDAFDSDHYRNMTRALAERFDRLGAALGEQANGPTATDDIPGGLAGLMETVLPEDSSVFRWGPIFGGVTTNVDGRIDALFAEFVTRHERPAAHRTRQQPQVQDTGKPR